MSSPSETKPHNGRDHKVIHGQQPDDITRFQYDLLAEIGARAPVKGLAIKRELELYYLEGVNHGRLYPNLDSLVDGGLVEKREANGRTNHYRLTDEGRRVLRDRADHLTERVEQLDEREQEGES